MTAFLVDNPLLVLFLVAAIGYLVGRVHLGSFSLGVSAVLFVGLAFGALDPEIGLPSIIFQFGLIVFVYTIGLAGGPGFVAALRRHGLRENAFVVAVLTMAAGLVVLAHRLLDLDAASAAGLFSGSLTNTPALATVLESISSGAGGRRVGRPGCRLLTGLSHRGAGRHRGREPADASVAGRRLTSRRSCNDSASPPRSWWTSPSTSPTTSTAPWHCCPSRARWTTSCWLASSETATSGSFGPTTCSRRATA